jgi:hypothetical protein
MKEITADAYIYKEFHDIALDLTDPVLGLITILRSAFLDSNGCKEFRTFIAELHCQCTDTTKTTSQFSSRLDHDLKYLDVSRNMREYLRVWIFSALASVSFLSPLRPAYCACKIDLSICTYYYTTFVV